MTIVHDSATTVGTPLRGVAARAVQATRTYGKGLGSVTALDHVDVEFDAGAFTTIMGPSGSGKSTLRRARLSRHGAESSRPRRPMSGEFGWFGCFVR